jgi:3-hydroxyisobutyrate dehydrogenase
MSHVAFFGTGLLGSAMVERMLHGGESVTVWNRTASKAGAVEALGARLVASPAQAVVGATRVHLALSDDSAVDAVTTAFLEALPAGAVVIDHTTTAPHTTVARYAAMAGRGVKFLHAPVFMSPAFARTGQGLMMTSGPEATFAAMRESLQRMTGEAWYLGDDPGRAAAYKLFGNAMIFAITAGAADVIALGRALGLSGTDALNVFSKFQPVGVIKGRGDKMAREDFAASFELAMARKDMRLMLELADGRPLAVLPAIAQRMDEAIAAGYAHDDLAAIVRALDSRAALPSER